MFFILLEGGVSMKSLKHIRDETKRIISENIIEILVATGTAFIFVGTYMIFKPLAYIVLGAVVLFLALIIYKNQQR